MIGCWVPRTHGYGSTEKTVVKCEKQQHWANFFGQVQPVYLFTGGHSHAEQLAFPFH